jgi:asparagine synthase (glutamine-hydrolysing)
MANNKRPTTFSVRFKDPLIDESKYLQAILEKTNLKNIPIVPSPEEMLKVFDTVIWHLEEPPPSSSDLAHFLLFDKMHQHGIKVNMCGQGADEILCGYDTFLIPYLREMKRKSKSLFLKETIRFIYLHPKTLARKLPTQIFQRFFASKSSGNPLHDKSDILGLQLSMIESLVLPFILISEDRLSMAFGIESRVPYLDHRLVEFCLSLPDSFKINKSKRKYILRECFKNQLPKLIYNRTDKIGFAAPISKRMVDSLLTKNTNIPEWLESKETHDKMKQWRIIGLSRWLNIFGIDS